jgi:uncharacterized protein
MRGLHPWVWLGYTSTRFVKPYKGVRSLSRRSARNTIAECEDGQTLLRLRLTPKGGKDAVIKREAGTLYARVAAPPVDGAANRALIALLSKTLAIPKSRITIISGETSRDKTVRIDGMPAVELDSRITEALAKLV